MLKKQDSTFSEDNKMKLENADSQSSKKEESNKMN